MVGPAAASLGWFEDGRSALGRAVEVGATWAAMAADGWEVLLFDLAPAFRARARGGGRRSTAVERSGGLEQQRSQIFAMSLLPMRTRGLGVEAGGNERGLGPAEGRGGLVAGAHGSSRWLGRVSASEQVGFRSGHVESSGSA
jgi:hypothetical protein